MSFGHVTQAHILAHAVIFLCCRLLKRRAITIMDEEADAVRYSKLHICISSGLFYGFTDLLKYALIPASRKFIFAAQWIKSQQMSKHTFTDKRKGAWGVGSAATEADQRALCEITTSPRFFNRLFYHDEFHWVRTAAFSYFPASKAAETRCGLK